MKNSTTLLDDVLILQDEILALANPLIQRDQVQQLLRFYLSGMTNRKYDSARVDMECLWEYLITGGIARWDSIIVKVNDLVMRATERYWFTQLAPIQEN